VKKSKIHSCLHENSTDGGVGIVSYKNTVFFAY